METTTSARFKDSHGTILLASILWYKTKIENQTKNRQNVPHRLVFEKTQPTLKYTQVIYQKKIVVNIHLQFIIPYKC